VETERWLRSNSILLWVSKAQLLLNYTYYSYCETRCISAILERKHIGVLLVGDWGAQARRRPGGPGVRTPQPPTRRPVRFA